MNITNITLPRPVCLLSMSWSSLPSGHWARVKLRLDLTRSAVLVAGAGARL